MIFKPTALAKALQTDPNTILASTAMAEFLGISTDSINLKIRNGSIVPTEPPATKNSARMLRLRDVLIAFGVPESELKRQATSAEAPPVPTSTVTVEVVERRKEDPTNPSYYRGKDGLQPIDVIEAFNLDFCLGTAVKYICRHGRKTTGAEAIVDLEKSIWYIQRAIAARRAAE